MAKEKEQRNLGGEYRALGFSNYHFFFFKLIFGSSCLFGKFSDFVNILTKDFAIFSVWEGGGSNFSS